MKNTEFWKNQGLQLIKSFDSRYELFFIEVSYTLNEQCITERYWYSDGMKAFNFYEKKRIEIFDNINFAPREIRMSELDLPTTKIIFKKFKKEIETYATKFKETSIFIYNELMINPKLEHFSQYDKRF